MLPMKKKMKHKNDLRSSPTMISICDPILHWPTVTLKILYHQPLTMFYWFPDQTVKERHQQEWRSHHKKSPGQKYMVTILADCLSGRGAFFMVWRCKPMQHMVLIHKFYEDRWLHLFSNVMLQWWEWLRHFYEQKVYCKKAWKEITSLSQSLRIIG